MLKEIFNQGDALPEKEPESYEEVDDKSDAPEPMYEEYEEEIEIKASELSKYVPNANALLKIKKNEY